MNPNNDHDYFVCKINAERAGAYLVELRNNGEVFWVPKSLCEIRPSPQAAAASSYDQRLEVEAWFASKEGMND